MAGQPDPVPDAPSLEDRVRLIVFDVLAAEPERQVDHAYLIQDLGADSLDVVEMEVDLEEEFGLSPDTLRLDRAITVGDVVRAVRDVVAVISKPVGAA